jgi:beta-N-acetylhexosaminidase
MEEAARSKIKFFVLDRPDPINGYDIEGPLAETELTSRPEFSFIAYHPIPVRYGMTIGELARLFNEERRIGADLTVIKIEGCGARITMMGRHSCGSTLRPICVA